MKAKNGDKVSVHYVGTLESGEKFDSSRDRNDPLEFTIGAGNMIPGFEKGVIGMEINEVKKVEIPSNEAYGEADPKNVVSFEKKMIPADMNPQVGDQLMLSDNQGQQVPAVVLELTDTHIKLDANHPMAGKNLFFEIELLTIN